MKDICLGTAQFSKSGYGKVKPKKLDKDIISKIIKYSIKKKIKYLDTALGYNGVDDLITSLSLDLRKINIITKIPYFKNNRSHNLNICEKKIINFLKNNNLSNYYGILLHDIRNIKHSEFKYYFKFLMDLKKRGYTKKIGVSINNLIEIKKIKKFFKPDIIQCSYNILDREIENKTFQEYIKKNKIQIFSRSVFLQGALLNSKFLKIIDKTKKHINYINYIKKINNFKIKLILINFVKKNFIDTVILGVNSQKELRENIKLLSLKKLNLKYPMFNFKVKKSVIKPYLWN